MQAPGLSDSADTCSFCVGRRLGRPELNSERPACLTCTATRPSSTSVPAGARGLLAQPVGCLLTTAEGIMIELQHAGEEHSSWLQVGAVGGPAQRRAGDVHLPHRLWRFTLDLGPPEPRPRSDPSELPVQTHRVPQVRYPVLESASQRSHAVGDADRVARSGMAVTHPEIHLSSLC